ncbi:hypothetical protein CDAR_439261 [Caerostris darwini]|uniref:Uncharacterized protein n=1 Tax=Caerostris darwini TaxID=1538125 RepID=A0AAV4MJB8_9ARAC|nr:hypothetical protein CDAR_439261 [Caerostris darwini]
MSYFGGTSFQRSFKEPAKPIETVLSGDIALVYNHVVGKSNHDKVLTVSVEVKTESRLLEDVFTRVMTE